MLNPELLKDRIKQLLVELSEMEDPSGNHLDTFSEYLSSAIHEYVKDAVVTIPPGTQVQVDPVTGIGSTIVNAIGSLQ